MLKEGMNGFCMALADSVPGVPAGRLHLLWDFMTSLLALSIIWHLER